MSGKKKTPKNDFSNSPFKSLRGLSVSAEPKPCSKPRKQAAGRDKRPQTGNEDVSSFEKEMQSLGVNRIACSDDFDETIDGTRPEGPAEKDGQGSGGIDDETLFRQALAGMDRVFKDDGSEARPVAAPPRRFRQLKLGHLKPGAELDLHGMTREEALVKVAYFLDNARHHGFSVVLIITGKGSRSGGGPVLRHAVVELLKRRPDQVVEWTDAPRQYGGSGALAVFLRGNFTGT